MKLDEIGFEEMVHIIAQMPIIGLMVLRFALKSIASFIGKSDKSGESGDEEVSKGGVKEVLPGRRSNYLKIISISTVIINLILFHRIFNMALTFLVIPAVYLFNAQQDLGAAEHDGWKRVGIPVANTNGQDEVILDAIIWKNKDMLPAVGSKDKPIPAGLRHPSLIYMEDKGSATWLVWMNANGMVKEHGTKFMTRYARKIKAHALMFDYRGVGASTSWPYNGASDLVEDGVAAINYLVNQGYNSSRIIIHGMSIGGAVAAAVRPKVGPGVLVADRALASLKAIGIDRCREPVFGAMMGALVLGGPATAVIDGLSVGFAMGSSATNLPTVAATSGAILGLTKLLLHVVPDVLETMGWVLPSDEGIVLHSVAGGVSLITYHKDDGIIRLPSSLATSSLIEDAQLDGVHLLQLQGPCKPGPECHLYTLDGDKHDWNKFWKQFRVMTKHFLSN